MGDKRNIRCLEGLLTSNIEKGEKIIGTEVSPLTAPGENYGSIMLRIDIKIKNEITGKTRILYTVGKCIPEIERILEVFNTQVTYRNEYMFYVQIVPILDNLFKSKDISRGAQLFAPFYGGRLNLNNSNYIDRDAIILLENLKLAGYTTGQKLEGFNLETSKVVLNSLAKFHAAGIALRSQEPDTFDEKLRPFFFCFEPEDILYYPVIDHVITILKENGFDSKETDVMDVYRKKNLKKRNINKIWGTMIHYDSWTNNFLLKYENNIPVHAVLVDFQVFDYGTPLNDVMFFLFTSVQQDIFAESLDPLLSYYYQQLLEYLLSLEVNTKPFTKESFQDEIKFAVKHYEYAHALWMLYPIMYQGFKSIDNPSHRVNTDWSKRHVERIVELSRICFQKGWL